MASYYVNEAVFSLPDRGFVDRTLHRLEASVDRGGETGKVGIEVRRVPMAAGKTLRQLVDEETASTREKVNGFTVVEEAEIVLAGAPAIVLRARLRAEDSVFVQLQAHVALGDTWIGFFVTGPSSLRTSCEETFDRMLRTLEWR